MAKLTATLFSAVTVVAVLWPVTQNWNLKRLDTFPLSYYGMFSEPPGDDVRVTHLVGIDSRGDQIPLSYKFAARGGMNQVRKQLRKRVRNGEAQRIARKAAARVARSDDPRLSDVEAVCVVTAKYRIDDFFSDHRTLVWWHQEAKYPVKRKSN